MALRLRPASRIGRSGQLWSDRMGNDAVDVPLMKIFELLQGKGGSIHRGCAHATVVHGPYLGPQQSGARRQLFSEDVTDLLEGRRVVDGYFHAPVTEVVQRDELTSSQQGWSVRERRHEQSNPQVGNELGKRRQEHNGVPFIGAHQMASTSVPTIDLAHSMVAFQFVCGATIPINAVTLGCVHKRRTG